MVLGRLTNLYKELSSSYSFFMLIYEEELSELEGMETNAVQDALVDTTMNFCKKTRDFRNRVFFFNYCILSVHNVSEYVVDIGCSDGQIHN